MNDDAHPGKQIRIEVEVPGTPEQVWDAIATGPGVTSWFVPAEIDEREGGDYTTVHGDTDGMKATETIRAWEPPMRLVTEYAEGENTLATEWLVEATSGRGTCVVRLVATAFGDGSWEDDLDSMDHGWRGYLANLRLYLTHFVGQSASTVLVSGNYPAPTSVAYEAICAELGFGDPPREGDKVTASGNAPRLRGTVEKAAPDYAILRLDEPAPALALLGAYGRDDNAMTVFHLYVFGGADAEPIQDEWRTWSAAHFPRKVSA